MTTITKEWLQQTIAEFENTRDDIPFGLSDDDAKILKVLKQALASFEAEPVGEFYHEKQDGWYQISEGDKVPDNRRIPLYTAPPAPVIPDGWISCSERMPEDEQEVIVHNKLGYRYVSYFDEHSGLFFDMRGGNQMNCIEHILITHWMPLPAPPQK
ncbi:DUF551 domain-containing protein [Salmonella enterica]|nr:DUF551 domain-containing protein [Salmonella enterica]EDH9772371.1 DUF551 domain-containing protein [Salmonella enterica subsp. enterica serovar Newport]